MTNRLLILPLFLTATLALLIPAAPAHADVWPTTHAWSEEYETAFSEEIRTLSLDVFTRADSPWKGIATDCSKAVYVLRTIFAYKNGLPVKFTNFTGRNLSNDSKEFDGVAEGMPRLMKFMNVMRQVVNTETLVKDSYPIEINRQRLRPGALFLHPQGGKEIPITYRAGHVYYIEEILDNGMIRYFSSTVPMIARDLQPRLDIVFAPFNTDGGYRAWKWPDSNVRPGQSSMQFELAGWHANIYDDTKFWKAWQAEIRARLAKREATLEEEFEATVYNVRGYINERSRLVKMAWNRYQSDYVRKGIACMNDEDYDDFSTPTRDVKIQSELAYLRRAAVKLIQSQGDDLPYQAIPGIFEKYSFEVIPGVKMDLNQLWKTFETTTVLSISEPEHSPAVRWGLESQEKWPCPQRAKQYKGGEYAGQH